MNLKTKGKGKRMVDRCSDKSVTYIENVFVKVLWTKIKATFLGFDDYLSNKYILIVDTVTVVNINNGTNIDQINYTPLLHVGDDYLLSTAQSREFVVATHDVANRHAGKQYIHY